MGGGTNAYFIRFTGGGGAVWQCLAPLVESRSFIDIMTPNPGERTT